jgi:N-acetylneuraminic acid mutarotase
MVPPISTLNFSASPLQHPEPHTSSTSENKDFFMRCSVAIGRRCPALDGCRGLSSALIAWAVLTVGVTARAHFVFVLPDEESTQARVILSETLEVDADIDPALVDGVKLVTRDGAGGEGALMLARDGEARLVKLPEQSRGAIHGTLTHGIMKHGPKPFLVVYHPKACLGYPFGSAARIGEESPAEIVPAGHPGAVRFQLLSHGQPVADAKMVVLLPDGKQEEVVTDAKGQTPVFDAAGRYGAWARHVVATPGEHAGEAYVEERHYPTIVIDAPAGHRGAAKETHATFTKTEKLPALPVAASSLGAVACDGHVYVYGGHIAPVHTYSTEAVTGRFFRRPLAGGDGWEELAGGPALQGMNLATHGGKIYRVGGMDPRNKPGEPAENFSVASAACYDPATNTWTDLPTIPEPRSSHDVAVVGDTLYVVGGWNMLGHEGEDWCDTMLALDLMDPTGGWKSLRQPFERRALIASVADGKLYVIGGFTEEEEISRRVDIFDSAGGTWSSGPELPGEPINGFAPAACTVAGRVHVSVADGSVHRLAETGSDWEPVASVVPRIVHRAVADGDAHLVLVGGAANAENLDLVERVPVR